MVCVIMVAKFKHCMILSKTFNRFDQQQYHLKSTNAKTMNRYKLVARKPAIDSVFLLQIFNHPVSNSIWDRNLDGCVMYFQ